MSKKYIQILSIALFLNLLAPTLSYAQENKIVVAHGKKKKASSLICRALKFALGAGQTGIGLLELHLYYMLNKASFNKQFPQETLKQIKDICHNETKKNKEKLEDLHKLLGQPVIGTLLTLNGLSLIARSLEG